MIPYLCLFIFIFLVYISLKPLISNEDKFQNIFLLITCIVLFVFSALKKGTGIDVPGYRILYEYSGTTPWNDLTGYGNFEHLYIYLMKFFNLFNLDFQWFLTFIYFILYLGLYLFLKNRSKNTLLSILIFLCFQFFIFTLTGLRQTLAMGLCMITVNFAYKNVNLKNVLCFFIIVFISCFIHKSSMIFFLFYFIIRIKTNKITYLIFYVLCSLFFLSSYVIYNYINDIFDTHQGNDAFSLGGAFIFMILIFIFTIITLNNKNQNSLSFLEKSYIPSLMMIVLIYALFYRSNLLRMAIYYQIMLLVILPNIIDTYKQKEKNIYLFLTSIMLLLLFSQAVFHNAFNIIPYLFFWE